MKTLLALAACAAISAPALAASHWSSDWIADRFEPMSKRLIENGGVRVTNCHLEWFNGAEAMPKCYAMNTSYGHAAVRVDFQLVDKAGEPVITPTLSTGSMPPMTGRELVQSVPISADERDRVYSAKVRVTVLTQ